MTVLRHTTACALCPFRRTSIPGYLGAERDPEQFTRAALADSGDRLPCHCTIDYTDDEWRDTQLSDAAMCAGALAMLSNQCKLPRDPDLAEVVQQVPSDPEVFTMATEFVEHHGGELPDNPVERHAVNMGLAL